LIGNNKVWAGSNKIDLTKDTTYDLSIYATKEELETVKGMIEVSARIVGSGKVSVRNGSDITTVPSCDYVIVYAPAVDISTYVFPEQNLLCYKGCSAELTTKGYYLNKYAGVILTASLSSSAVYLTLSVNIEVGIDVNYVCYKYDT